MNQEELPVLMMKQQLELGLLPLYFLLASYHQILVWPVALFALFCFLLHSFYVLRFPFHLSHSH